MPNPTNTVTTKKTKNPLGGRPSKRPPYDFLVYLSEERGMQTRDLAEFFGVQSSTIRAWRCLKRQGKY